MGISTGFSVGMGWIWGLKSNPHDIPADSDKQGGTRVRCANVVGLLQVRTLMRKVSAQKFVNRVAAKHSSEVRRPEQSYAVDPTDVVFQTD